MAEFLAILLGALLAGILSTLSIGRASALRHLMTEIDRPFRVGSVRFTAGDAIHFACVVFYVTVASVLMVQKHDNLYSSYDFAIADQAVYNSLNGRLLETSITGLGSTWLGTHFAPLLLALVPIYALWDDPRSLLVLQSMALGFTAFPLYWLAKKSLGRPLALAISIAFLLYPAQLNVNLADFHDLALLTPLLTLAAYFMLRERDIPFLVCVGAALLVREEAGPVIFALGCFNFLVRRKRWGLGLAAFGLVWTIALMQFVIPYFSGRSDNYIVRLHYGSYGNSLMEVLFSFLVKPESLSAKLFNSGTIESLLRLLVPLLFLPLAGAEIALMSLPTIAYLVLEAGPQGIPGAHYTAPLLPFLFCGMILGLSRAAKWGERVIAPRMSQTEKAAGFQVVRVGLAIALLVGALASYYSYAPGPFARNYPSGFFGAVNARTAWVRDALTQIPPGASILTQAGLAPHLTHRRLVYYYPFILDSRQAEYIVIDTTRCDWCKKDLEAIQSSQYYDVIGSQNDVFIARRKDVQVEFKAQFEGTVSLLGYRLLPSMAQPLDRKFVAILYLQPEKELDTDYRVRLSLIDSQGHVWARETHSTQEGAYPRYSWLPGERVGDEHALSFPPTMPPGDYQVALSVVDPRANRSLVGRNAGGELGVQVPLTTVSVTKDKSNVTASQLRDRFLLENPFFADMGEMRLIGYASLPKEILAGEMLEAGLYWRARDKPRGDYLVGIQLRDSNGKVQLEQRNRPAAGAYPTLLWDAGEVLLDWHDLTLTGVAPGIYNVVVVLSHYASGQAVGEATITNLEIVEKP